MNEKEFENMSIAHKMLSVIIENMDDNNKVTAVGVGELVKLFGEVETEDRAEVYLDLVDMIEGAGIPFDIVEAAKIGG